VSHERPVPGCWELPLGDGLALPPGAQVALEDYARALAGAAQAAVVPAEEASRVRAVHLCGTAAPPAASVREDVAAFARELAGREGDGLGWS
jgi:hypothetical protein